MKKASPGKIFLITIAVLVVILAVTFFGAYNAMATARENVNTQQAAIETQLQRRSDLIPNLVNTVKGLASQETAVISSVTQARAKLAGASTIPEMAQANAELSGALSRLLLVVENYPQIQSSGGYLSLMDELSGTENRIGAARIDYNEAVKAYNSQIIRFPNRMLAGLFGFEKAQYFTASESAENAPQVNFS